MVAAAAVVAVVSVAAALVVVVVLALAAAAAAVAQERSAVGRNGGQKEHFRLPAMKDSTLNAYGPAWPCGAGQGAGDPRAAR